MNVRVIKARFSGKLMATIRCEFILRIKHIEIEENSWNLVTLYASRVHRENEQNWDRGKRFLWFSCLIKRNKIVKLSENSLANEVDERKAQWNKQNTDHRLLFINPLNEFYVLLDRKMQTLLPTAIALGDNCLNALLVACSWNTRIVCNDWLTLLRSSNFYIRLYIYISTYTYVNSMSVCIVVLERFIYRKMLLSEWASGVSHDLKAKWNEGKGESSARHMITRTRNVVAKLTSNFKFVVQLF